MDVYICMYMLICIHTYEYVYIHMYNVHTYIRMYVCTCMHTYIHTCILIHIITMHHSYKLDSEHMQYTCECAMHNLSHVQNKSPTYCDSNGIETIATLSAII